MDDVIKAVAACLVGLTALASAVAAMFVSVRRAWKEITRQNDQLDEFWKSHLSRGLLEAIENDLVVDTVSPNEAASEEDWTMPVAVRERAAKLFTPEVRDILRDIRAKNPDASESELGRRIERRLRWWLIRNVCKPLGVNQFACVVMAVSIANGVPPIPDSTHD